MRILVQRVTSARVAVSGEVVGEIHPDGQGLVALVGVATEHQAAALVVAADTTSTPTSAHAFLSANAAHVCAVSVGTLTFASLHGLKEGSPQSTQSRRVVF